MRKKVKRIKVIALNVNCKEPDLSDNPNTVDSLYLNFAYLK